MHLGMPVAKQDLHTALQHQVFASLRFDLKTAID
jgi:hypothetical protein